MRRFAAAVIAAVTATAAPAQMMGAAPAAPPPVAVRGTIASVTGQTIEINGKGGGKLTLRLSPDARIATADVITIDGIKPNSFIGTAAEPGRNGTLVATEVHVFPESMRGVGEGHRPWDTSKTSSMTNGNVGAVKTGGLAGKSGRTLTVDYKGGQQTVYVPASVPIVMFAAGTMANLVPGATVFSFAQRLDDGKLAGNSLVVGINGAVPPM